MSNGCKPSTRRLLHALGWEEISEQSERDELYRVYSAAVELSNRAYHTLDRQTYDHGSWPGEPEIIEALRDALAGHRGDYAGKELAYTLVRYGCRRPETMTALDAWDALMFTWQAEGTTARRARDLLCDAGIIDGVSDAALQTIDGWIADPLGALRGAYSFIFTLFDKRAVFASLRDIGFEPGHDALLRDLASSAAPPVELSAVSQRLDSDERFVESVEPVYVTTANGSGGYEHVLSEVPVMRESGAHWVIEFSHQGARHGFFAQTNGTWMDVSAVQTHFAQFMATLGRTEHAFRFATARSDSSEFGAFLAADAQRFTAVARKLHIPLHAA